MMPLWRLLWAMYEQPGPIHLAYPPPEAYIPLYTHAHTHTHTHTHTRQP